jgi:pimeloyl-ACP methyl ester carboxylesterase
MWAGIVLAIVGLTFASAGSGAEVQGSAERPALGNQVREYVFTDEEETADRVLADILADPRATVETVQPILKAGRAYGEAPVGAQTQMPVRVRQKTYRYGLYVPASYRPDKEYALVVCLHGAGFTGDAYLERWQTRLGEDYILACPTLIQGTWWTRTAEDLVLATIRVVTAKYRIDPDRIFLTGMSNGGIGTYLIGSHHATRFAGLAPMAAGLDDVLMPFVENLRHTPVYIIHGSKDEVMPVEMSRSMDKELTRLGYPHVYREHEKIHPMAGGHFFPREELPELVAWFGAQRRTAVPSSLTVVRDATHLTSFGWVRIDATDRIAAFSENLIDRRDETIVNRIYARLEAAVVAPNRIEVKTQRIRRYSLFLNEDMIDTSKPVTVLTDGRVSYDGPVTTAVEVLLREARHRQDPHQLFPIRLTINVDEPR